MYKTGHNTTDVEWNFKLAHTELSIHASKNEILEGTWKDLVAIEAIRLGDLILLGIICLVKKLVKYFKCL